jgi:hypothetical protein
VEVKYPASTAENELQVAVTYRIWIPDGVSNLRGIIVHRHGAGTTASNVRVSSKGDGGVEITWSAEADFESGIRGFVVLRDGQELANVPEKPVGKCMAFGFSGRGLDSTYAAVDRLPTRSRRT